MEHHKNILKDALSKLPAFQPSDHVWAGIETKLKEIPLHEALKKLPSLEPEEFIWENIQSKSVKEKYRNPIWWYAAAMIFLAVPIGFWFAQNPANASVSYSKETMDVRLQVKKTKSTDLQYDKLKRYCEAETVVCKSPDFRQLQQEYEALVRASRQLQDAMGAYNTEPELMRQFSIVEQGKAEILNEMAKMI